MFEIKSAREKQGRESAESAGDKYECGEIFECDKYMNIVKVKPGIGYLQRSWSSDSSNLLNLHLWGEASGPLRGPRGVGRARSRAILSRNCPSVRSTTFSLAAAVGQAFGTDIGTQHGSPVTTGAVVSSLQGPLLLHSCSPEMLHPPYPSLPWPGETAHRQWLTSRGVGVWLPCLKVGWILKGNPCSLSDQAKARVTVALSLLTISLPYPASLTPLLLRALPQEILCTRILVSGSASR